MINGVLVERTVKDVVPALQTNSEGLKKVLEELMKQYRSKQVEMETWKVSLLYRHPLYHNESPWLIIFHSQKKNNIQVVSQ